jgi:hypothetical protein
MISHITDHVARTLANLPSRFSIAARLRALVTILATECQTLEDTLWDLISDRMLSTAAGVQLDAYGELVGQVRLGGFTDDEYRRLISVRIRANKTSGQVEDVIQIMSMLLAPFAVGVGSDVHYWPLPPAAYGLEWVRDTYSSAAVVAMLPAFVVAITGAGIGVDELVEALPGYWGFEGDDDALSLGDGDFTAVLIT